MSLYILKTNEPALLQQGFEDILNIISEQPKVVLSGTCQSLNEIEWEKRQLGQQVIIDKDEEVKAEEAEQAKMDAKGSFTSRDTTIY